MGHIKDSPEREQVGFRPFITSSTNKHPFLEENPLRTIVTIQGYERRIHFGEKESGI
jgi:hypothetical protein